MISFLGSACFRLAVLPGVPGEEKPAKAAGLENLKEEEKSTHLQEVCFLRYVGWIIDSFQVFLWG